DSVQPALLRFRSTSRPSSDRRRFEEGHRPHQGHDRGAVGVSFPRHAAYKESGFEWLGAIPEHWNVGQSRRLFALRNQGALESDKQLTASQEYGVIYQEEFVQREGRRVVQVITGVDILKHVEPGDFVIS